MPDLRLGDVLRACNGMLHGARLDPTWAREVRFSSVVTDSREAVPGSLFVALRGERADGHDFVGEATRRGAAGAMVSRVPSGAEELRIPLIIVEDTLKALGALASAYRLRFNPLVVGITGSVGKTTTKEMTAAVLGVKHRVLKTEGNMNTEIGVPLTVFRLTDDHDVAVFEMAMRARGEIAWLAGIARPRIGVITNIGETHLERLGSRENIALAKAELLEALPEDGCAVLNGDNEWVRWVRDKARCRSVYYGMTPSCEVTAEDVRSGPDGTRFRLKTPSGTADCFITIPGEHHVYNALAAATVGLNSGLDPSEVSEGLGRFRTGRMRSEVLEADGVTIINDAYNASPVSTKAALQVLKTLARGRAIAVLGNMLELGEYAVQGHREVGLEAARLKLDLLVTVGDLAENIADAAISAGMNAGSVIACGTKEEAVKLLRERVRPGDTVLVKGSRGMKMERIIEGLTGSGGTAG